MNTLKILIQKTLKDVSNLPGIFRMKTNTKILEDITVYDPIVKHVAEKLDTFTAEHVRLVAEAKELPMPEKNSQWGNVLRSAQSRGLCKPIDRFEKSRYKGTNAVPRMVWIKPSRRKELN